MTTENQLGFTVKAPIKDGDTVASNKVLLGVSNATPGGGAFGVVQGGRFIPLDRVQRVPFGFEDHPIIVHMPVETDEGWKDRTGRPYNGNKKTGTMSDRDLAIRGVGDIGVYRGSNDGDPVRYEVYTDRIYVPDIVEGDSDFPAPPGFVIHTSENGKSTYDVTEDVDLYYKLHSSSLSNTEYPHKATPYAGSATYPISTGSTITLNSAQEGTLWDGESTISVDFDGNDVMYLTVSLLADGVVGTRYAFYHQAATFYPLQSKMYVSYDSSTKKLTFSSHNGATFYYREGVWPYYNWLNTAYTGPIDITETITYSYVAMHPSYPFTGRNSINLQTVTIEIDPDTGDSITDSFSETILIDMDKKYAEFAQDSYFDDRRFVTWPSKEVYQLALMPQPMPNRWISPNGTGDGLSPDSPSDWDGILDATLPSYPLVVAALEGTYEQEQFNLPEYCRVIGGYYNDFADRDTVGHPSIIRPKAIVSEYETVADPLVVNYEITSPNGSSLGEVFTNTDDTYSILEGFTLEAPTDSLWKGFVYLSNMVAIDVKCVNQTFGFSKYNYLIKRISADQVHQ